MKKSKSKTSFSDPLIVARVKNYLAENVDKTYVDVSEMARCLKQRHSEYSNRNDGAFCKMVEGAYKIVLDTYGLKGASTSEGSEEEIDRENMTEKNNLLNERLVNLYNKPGKSNEPIDILSSDEDDGPTPNKLPKINDQIIVTQHIVSNGAVKQTPTRSKSNGIGIHSTSKASSSGNYPTPKPVAVKKKFDVVATKTVQVTLEDMGGISDIMEQVTDLVLHMKHPEVYEKLGIKYPRGGLLHGPPGTGKTLLAYAIAGSLGLPLFAVSGTELVGGVSGESEERIRELFERASSIAPCILFIDEIDAICSNRINAQKDMEKRMVSQLLSSLDALGEKKVNVLVLAATNNPDTLDPALRRAGRLEQEIALGIPTQKARKEILSFLCKDLTLDDSVDFVRLAQITPGFVGADLQALITKASTNAVKRAFMLIKAKKDVLNGKDVQSEDRELNLETIIDENIPSGQPVILENKEPENKELSPSDEKETSQSKEELQVEVVISDKEEATEQEVDTDTTVIKGLQEEGPAGDTATDNNDEMATDETSSPAGDNVLAKEINLQVNVINSTDELYELLDDNTTYTAEQLSGISINVNDFLSALKTTKPCAVREGIVTVPDVTWQDVGSLNEVRKDLQLAVMAPVLYPHLLKSLGLSVPSGVLLCGPPGCGKTLLAKAVANEAGVNFISVKGPELLNMYVGESERAVRTCFRRARNSAPCVIFFDEFDALCPRRTPHDNNGASRVVNQLLTEMDGIETREGVFILAASNRPDIIDPAVLRPGRLDRVIYVGMPDLEDRVDILQKLTKQGTQPELHSDVNLHDVAEQADGYTGADLAGLVRSAATAALTNYIAQPNMVAVQDAVVTIENFTEALAKCRPSVSAKQLKHYEMLKAKYSSSAGENKMETENAETMDTC